MATAPLMRVFEGVHPTAHATASALLAALALAMLRLLPSLCGLYVRLACLWPLPYFVSLRARSRRTRHTLRRAPAGVLLIGVLSNAGGLAF